MTTRELGFYLELGNNSFTLEIVDHIFYIKHACTENPVVQFDLNDDSIQDSVTKGIYKTVRDIVRANINDYEETDRDETEPYNAEYEYALRLLEQISSNSY